MTAVEASRLCRLELARGHLERCPAEACPFWDSDEPPSGRCAVEEVDFSGRPELADLLLRLRKQLESAATDVEEDTARERLYRLLSTGDADGG